MKSKTHRDLKNGDAGMSETVALFDRILLRQKRARCAGSITDYAFLMEWSAQQIQDRLRDIKRDFTRGLQIGTRGAVDVGAAELASMDITPALPVSVVADEEFLPFAHGSLDLVVSNLSLHSTNDLPGVLVQIRRALQADGLFIASMLGGETLRELRESLMQAELAVMGGVSPRIMPFADKPQMGDLLQRAGFALPVVDSEIVTVTYNNMFNLIQDLRGMGETSIIANRAKHFMRRDVLTAAAAHYAENFAEPDGRLRASFEVIFLIGWTPHESQQKPLRPGSAKTRLADALGAKETKL